MRWIVVHTGDRRAHLFIGQGEEPTDATPRPIRQMQPKSLNEHHVGELLSDQRATRLRIAQLLLHPFYRPSHRSSIGFLADMHDGRKRPQQNVGMTATRSEEHTSELQSLRHLVCRLL